MNSELKRFLSAERKRVVEPGPDFASRVVARAASLPARAVQFGENIWDVVPVAARPVFALALGLILAFVVIQGLMPDVPQEGFVTSYLESESADGGLYVETDLLTSDEALGQWIVSEGGL
jgi:hypothetical protein